MGSQYLAIVAHAGARDTLADFWPAWKRLGVPIVVFLPEGEAWPIEPMPDYIFNYGKSAHKGPEAFKRLVHCFKTLAGLGGHCEFTIIEPDCLPLKDRLPVQYFGKLGGWVCRINDGEHPHLFPWALLPPWTADTPTLHKLASRAAEWANVSHPDCLDLSDRWLMKVASQAEIQTMMLPNVLGYAWFKGVLQKMREHPHLDWVHGFKRKAELEDLWPIA